jgi:hypothetical protein
MPNDNGDGETHEPGPEAAPLDPLRDLAATTREALRESNQLQAAAIQKVAGVVAGALTGLIGGQAEDIAKLETRLKRLEKTVIALIQRKPPPRWTSGTDEEEELS